jgi:hypothetical protein
MNLNFTPTPQQFLDYTPLESMLVQLKHTHEFTEEQIEEIEKAILNAHTFFLENEGSFELEVENRAEREEPKNIIKVDFSS